MASKRVTINTIMSWEPCDRYDRTSVTELFGSVCGRRNHMTLADAVKLNIPPVDLYWLVFRNEFLTDRQMHEIAIFCWNKIAKKIWDKYYPDDDRPNNAVKVKKRWLDGKATDEELDAARDAAYGAAYGAARDASRNAAYAAARDAAYGAAYASARAAAYGAARDASHKKIINKIKSYIEGVIKHA